MFSCKYKRNQDRNVTKNSVQKVNHSKHLSEARAGRINSKNASTKQEPFEISWTCKPRSSGKSRLHIRQTSGQRQRLYSIKLLWSTISPPLLLYSMDTILCKHRYQLLTHRSSSGQNIEQNYSGHRQRLYPIKPLGSSFILPLPSFVNTVL